MTEKLKIPRLVSSIGCETVAAAPFKEILTPTLVNIGGLWTDTYVKKIK